MDNGKRAKICEFLREIWFLIAFLILLLGVGVIALLLKFYIQFWQYADMFWSVSENFLMGFMPIIVLFSIISGLKEYLRNDFRDFEDFKKGVKKYFEDKVNWAKKRGKRIAIILFLIFGCGAVIGELLKGIIYLYLL